MVLLKIFVILVVAAPASYGQGISSRMVNGNPADTLRRFPHHVTIQPLISNDFYQGQNKLDKCSGSILNKRWIMTSLQCVSKGDTLEIKFQKLYKNSTAKSYSFIVNNDEDSVYPYPTLSDDLAVVQSPFDILFSDTVRPISISSKSPSQWLKKLVVLPGFDEQKDQLVYAMLSVTSNDACKNSYGNYDEYLNLCAVPNGNNPNAPCLTESGAGLVGGWPSRPELVGVYSSMSYDCDRYIPSVFINLVKYVSWIESIVGQTGVTTTSTTYAPTTWAPA